MTLDSVAHISTTEFAHGAHQDASRIPSYKPKRLCGKLLVFLHGMREAGISLELEVEDTLLAHRLVQRASCPFVSRRDDQDVSQFDHGDDFLVAGNYADTKFVVDVLRSRFIVQDRTLLGSW